MGVRNKWRMRSQLGTKGFAGDGIISDDYSEESGNKKQFNSIKARFPLDKCTPESLNGPVIIVQEGKKKERVNDERLLQEEK